MKATNLSNLLKIAATSIGIISMTSTAANAGVLTNGTTINEFLECINDGVGLVVGTNPAQNGWYYAADAANDGSGGSAYEIYGMGVKETDTSIIVALRANMPLAGTSDSVAADGNIGWGDMFFNFSGLNFTDATNQGKLFGVRFADTNDSGVADVGLYGNVTAKSVTGENHGYSSIDSYYSAHSNATLGDIPITGNYFDRTKSLNEIASGRYLTGLTFLSNTQLTAAGFDLNKFSGQTIAFQFDKSALSIPEPATLGGLAVVGASLAASLLRKKN